MIITIALNAVDGMEFKRVKQKFDKRIVKQRWRTVGVIKEKRSPRTD